MLIRKYLRNECTEEEATQVRRWYDSYESREDPLFSLTEPERQELKDRMLSRICLNISSNKLREEDAPKVANVRRLVYIICSSAAAFLVFLAGLFLLSDMDYTSNSGKQDEIITVGNPTSTIRKLLLPDSSRVWLSPGGRLKYAQQFNKRVRRVELEGEAFFEVKRDERHPFVIKSGEVLTKVLGTSFRIRAYSKNNSTEVSVLTGMVTVSALSGQVKEMVLLPKDKATYRKSTHRIEKDEDNSSSMEQWKRTSLRFQDVSIRHVAKILSDRFAVKMVAGDEAINEYLLNGDFSDQNLADILSMLEQSLNISYEINGTNIILKKREVNAHL